MKFQVIAEYQTNCVSKKTGNTYDRVIIDFGKFKKLCVLSDLESDCLKNLHESKKSSE